MWILWIVVLCFAQATPTAARGGSEADRVSGLLRAGRYGEAERAARQLLEQMGGSAAPDSGSIAEVLDMLAEALRRGGMAADPEAESACRRALDLKERLLPQGDPRIASSLYNLAALHHARGEYPKSLEVLGRALKIREDALGPNHPDVAKTLLLMATVRSTIGEDAIAQPLVERALAILESVPGPEPPDLALALTALAVLRFNAGDYAGAEPLHERALATNERIHGADHPAIGTSLHNLAVLRYAMGDYAGAKQGFAKALRIREATLGREHAIVAHTLTGLAMTLKAMRNYAGARSYYQRALRIQERSLGMGHDDVGWTLMRLGELMNEEREFSKARPLLERALTLLEQSLGRYHPYVAEDLVELAVANGASGDAPGARSMFERALAIQERELGAGHPEPGVTLSRYARFLAESGDTVGAIDAALRSEAVFREHLRLTCRELTERRAIGYAASQMPGRALALAVLARGPRVAPSTIEQVWNAVIRARSLVLDELATRGRLVGDLARSAKALEESRQRLANLLVRGPENDTPEHYRALVDRAREEAEQAERWLASRSTVFRADRARGEIGWVEVASSLPQGSALVAYVAYGLGEKRAYLAFLLIGGGHDPVIVPIGEARDVDGLVARWTREIVGAASKDEAELLSAEAVCRRAGAELRRKVWDPLSSWLGSVERVYLVPDGSLYLVNWAALPVGAAAYLAEEGPLLHVLSTERDLVRGDPERRPGVGLLAIGGPAYGAAGPDAPTARGAPKRDGAPSRAAKRGVSDPTERDCGGFSSVRFDPLPESIREVDEIAAIWPDRGTAVVLTGDEATEVTFKQRSPGRRVLHIATHAFFLNGPCAETRPQSRGIGGLTSGPEPRPSKREEAGNLLLLSGLALAGANQRGTVAPGQDDGILTAQEVASLDLSGVDWAVLSGCDTGVGAIQVGEGVQGLRRAFQVAGAGTVIMSLWPVDDALARSWMKALYEGRYREKLRTAEAVREANRSVLRERRAQARSTHPTTWAGFVAAGDWR